MIHSGQLDAAANAAGRGHKNRSAPGCVSFKAT
jgi:hypothetical protein